MEIKENTPIIIFDNQCYLCVKFAKVIEFFARGKITIVGHYSDFGKEIREDVLDESALEMFWFIDTKRARGGRAALVPLFKSFFSKRTKKLISSKIDDNCEQDCKTVKAIFVRSSSLLTNSKKIYF
jgi:vacuolar-type H+-ATPase catalytic subunit A/Vma1